MGSKAPPPSLPPEASSQEDDAIGLPRSVSLLTGSTPLRRIADALEISPTVLYQPQSVKEAASRPMAQAEGNGDLSRECYALIHAFMRISDPEARIRILALVQASAERA